MGQIAQSVWRPFYTLYIHTRKEICTRSICLKFSILRIKYWMIALFEIIKVSSMLILQWYTSWLLQLLSFPHQHSTSIWCKTHFTNHPVSRMSMSLSIDKSLLHVANSLKSFKLTYTLVFVIQIVFWEIYCIFRKDFKIFPI